MKKLIALLTTLAAAISPAFAETTAPAADQHTTAKSGDFFKKMDADGNGTVSLDEFKAGLSAQKDSAAVEDYFNKLDTDTDGKLTLDEYTKHVKPATTPPHHEETPAQATHPQAPTGNEAPRTHATEPQKNTGPDQHPPATNTQPSGAEVYFKKMDTNNDGAISPLEFKASSMGQNNPRMAEEYFKKLDTDHDGKVTLSEFTAHRSQASSSYHKSNPPKSSTSLVTPHLKDPNSNERHRRK